MNQTRIYLFTLLQVEKEKLSFLVGIINRKYQGCHFAWKSAREKDLV